MIYFIQAGSTGPIKIGYTKNEETLVTRLASLQSSNHNKLKIIKKLEGDKEKERKLHRKFANMHIRGEWFEPKEKPKSLTEQYKLKSNSKLRIKMITKVNSNKICRACNSGNRAEYYIWIDEDIKVPVCDNCKYLSAQTLIRLIGYYL